MPPANQRPSLPDAFISPAAKRRYVRQLFSTIAHRYDLITRLLSFGLDQRWKRRLMALSGVRRGQRVLDLACGTGDLAFSAEAQGASVVGLDLAMPMLALARRKPRGDRITWMAGDMHALPIASGTCDLVTTGYGLRNVPALPDSLQEIARVLRDDGRLCALDFDRPQAPLLRAVYLSYLTVVGSTLGWLLHRNPDTYRYIPESIKRYPGSHGVADMMRAAGFAEVTVVPLLGGLMAIHVARK